MSRKSSSTQIVARMPTEEEFWKLAKATGYSGLISRRCVGTALENSLFGVVATDDDKVIGTGRIVGDGAIFYYIQDLMVMPKYQRQGVASAMLDGLMDYINENAQWPCYISLFTSSGLKQLFSPYGFAGPEDFLYGMSVGKPAKKKLRRRKTSG